jgi:hypothetical protein
MPSIAGAASEFAGAVRSVLGLSRHSRLREQIHDTIDLFEKAVGHEKLSRSTGHLSEVINFQTERLLALQTPGVPRAWAWGPFSVGIGFTAIIAVPGWFTWRFVPHWWAWTIVVIDGLFVALFLAVSLALLLNRKSDEETAAT